MLEFLKSLWKSVSPAPERERRDPASATAPSANRPHAASVAIPAPAAAPGDRAPEAVSAGPVVAAPVEPIGPAGSGARSGASEVPVSAPASSGPAARPAPAREPWAEDPAFTGDVQGWLRETLEARRRELSARTSGTGDLDEVLEAIAAADLELIRQPPIAAQQALTVARDPESTTSALVRIFENDPAMAHGLLTVANSVFYRRGGEVCSSIGHAVQRIGGRAIEGVVISRLVEGTLCRPGGAYDPVLNEVWSHMTRTAPIARDLAATFGVQPERAFTMGLLHDLGKLVILDHLSGFRSRNRRDARLPDRAFPDLLHRLHEPLGGLAMLRWELGEDSALSVATHHRDTVPAAGDRLAELLFVAERVDHVFREQRLMDLDRLIAEGRLTVERGALLQALCGELLVPIYGGSPAPASGTGDPAERLAA